MSDTGNSTTLKCNAGDSTINLTTYVDKYGKENYVTQLKDDKGKEVFHVTTHPNGTVNYTDSNGKRISLRG